MNLILRFISLIVFMVFLTLSQNVDKLFAQKELLFTDITLSSGINTPDGGHATIFSDLNNDNLPDLYITMYFFVSSPMSDLFYLNNGDNIFVEEGAIRGINDFDGGSHGACFSDLDNDGDYDLVNGATFGTDSELSIYKNDGTGYFTDVTELSGIPERDWPTRGVTAFDMDGDGDLDLFCVNGYLGSDDPPGERNEVYRNDGDMKFYAINYGPLYTCPAGQGVTATDYDNDNDIDLIAANRTGDFNILKNIGNGNYQLISPGSIGIIHQAGDGITMADVNNDNVLDMLLASDNEGYLYLGNENGNFAYHQSFNITDGYMGGFADLDNDGDVDLVFAGDNICYLNDGNGNFSSGPSIPVIGLNDPRAIGFADIDNDGDIDFAIGCKRSRSYLIRNNLNSGNWLKIKLISPQGQAGAFGVKVRTYQAGQAKIGNLLGMREARSNNGYLGQDDPVLHFGLGNHTVVDIVVNFLDTSEIVRSNVSVNQTITIDGRDGNSKYYLNVRNGGGSGYYEEGAMVNISAKSPPVNHIFDQWIGDVEYISDVNCPNTTIIMSSENITVSANYKPSNGPFERWGIFELELKAKQEYENSYQEDILWATFLGPTKIFLVPGFWDGDSTWKIRISPSEVGTWTYYTESADPGLNINGSFVCVNNTINHGGIEAMQGFPYHFQYQDGTPFWWFGETCWAGFSSDSSENLSTESFKNYIDVRASHGFNYIHSNLLHGPNEGGQPFIGDLGNKINPSFWQVVDERVKYMNDKGITSGLMLTWKQGNYLDWTQFPDQVSRKRYAKYVASRYGAYKVVFILSGEYDEGSSNHPNSLSDWEEISNSVKEADPHNRMIAIHPSNGSAEEFADESWMNFGDYMQIYENLHGSILQCRDHNKPVVNSEYAYFLRDKDEDGIVDKPNSATREDFRYASWDIAMAGGYFVTGFRATYLGGLNYIGPFNVNDPESDLAEIDLQNINMFFNQCEWWKFNPSDNLVSGEGIHYCLRNGTDEYIVYIRNTVNAVVLDFGSSSSDEYAVFRYDTRDGSFNYLCNHSADTSMSLLPPNDDDWVFYISKNPPLNISGNVIYYSNSRPIQDATINLLGNQSQTQLSNFEGYYTVLILNHGENYTITASKPADENIGLFAITTYDAALTAQAAVGVRTLNDYESIAADVSRDGLIYTYDAALIAQYAVGLPKVSASHVAEWKFVPDNYYYESLNSNQTNQNFTGIILGNVHGGWSQPGVQLKQSVAFKKYERLKDIRSRKGEVIQIPIEIEAGQHVISAYIEFSYDPMMLKYKGIKRTCLSRDIKIVYKKENGRLRIGLYNTKPIEKSGVLISLQFLVYGDTNVTSELSLDQYQLNNYDIMAAKSQLVIGEKLELPSKFSLDQNYPNPFNIETNIQYQLPENCYVSVSIFNLKGRLISVLLDNKYHDAGFYSIIWNGKDNSDSTVPSGLYLYRIKTKEYSQLKKMILVK